MEEIEAAFRKAYQSRTCLILWLLLPTVFLLSMNIAGYFLTTAQSLLIALVLMLLVILGRALLIRNPRILKKNIYKAFPRKEEYDEFVKSIAYELHSADTKRQTIPSEKIFICVTATWLILITPNGSLICKRKNVTNIKLTLSTSNSRHSLTVILSSTETFLFPYPDLEKILTSWILN